MLRKNTAQHLFYFASSNKSKCRKEWLLRLVERLFERIACMSSILIFRKDVAQQKHHSCSVVLFIKCLCSLKGKACGKRLNRAVECADIPVSAAR